ncbi:MAG TPA: Uma2 family endonuclease [Gemmatimonadaceae bacterium]|jgi:Uma2 family endonuclease
MAVAINTKRWTLAEVHRLPDDGNKYELVRGELFVTPPPSDEHETIAALLTEILVPYVRAHGLGHVYRPKAVMRYSGSEVEPDLMVRAAHPHRKGKDTDWNSAPIPILVVEILSEFTRRRDHHEKKALYLEAGVAEYWIVDPFERTIAAAGRGKADRVEDLQMSWSPGGAATPLGFAVASNFPA